MSAIYFNQLTRENALTVADAMRTHKPHAVKDRSWHGMAKSVLLYSDGRGILNVEAERVVMAIRLEIAMMPPGAFPDLQAALSILSPV